MNVLHHMENGSWGRPFTDREQREAIHALECGCILVFPKPAFSLLPEEHALLTPRILGGYAKNVSMNPEGELKHAAAKGEQREVLRGLMRRFANDAAEVVENLLPPYRGKIDLARTSLRPVEIEGRRYRPTADDTRLHVDAFPSTPMRRRRILRVFANINGNDKPRIWNVGEPFEDMARKMLPRVRRPLPGLSWLYAVLGATMGRRSTYDELMLGLHDGVKLDLDYQRTSPRQQMEFVPGTAWMCFTDQVMHAALSGQHALEQTFYLPIGAMQDPSHAPLRVLERLTGRVLA